MFCEKCGHRLDDNSLYCIKCGSKIKKEENSNKPFSNIFWIISGMVFFVSIIIFFLSFIVISETNKVVEVKNEHINEYSNYDNIDNF